MYILNVLIMFLVMAMCLIAGVIYHGWYDTELPETWIQLIYMTVLFPVWWVNKKLKERKSR